MVTPANIAVELGRPTPEPDSLTHQQWTRWIADAYWIISRRLGPYDALALEVQEVVDYVVRLAVARHARRPEDATQVTVSVDDASTSRMYQSGTGRVTILDEWWEWLDPASSGGAFTIYPAGDSP